jgi:hypothetical protein
MEGVRSALRGDRKAYRLSDQGSPPMGLIGATNRPSGLLRGRAAKRTIGWRRLKAWFCDMRDFDLHRWFAPGELEQCPACQKEAGIRLPESGSFLCLECGHAEAAQAVAETHVSPTEPV